MGMSMFSNCKCYPKKSEVVAPNPNPLNFKIREELQIGLNVVAVIHYPDCINFEGLKICVFKNMTSHQLWNMVSIDPHFENNNQAPFARFKPTEEGFKAAILLAENI